MRAMPENEKPPAMPVDIYYNDEIIIPSYENFCNIIMVSDAYKFCTDPGLFFDDL